MEFLLNLKYTYILVVNKEEKQRSMKDNLKSKSVVQKSKLSAIWLIKHVFPNAVMTYIVRNTKYTAILI